MGNGLQVSPTATILFYAGKAGERAQRAIKTRYARSASCPHASCLMPHARGKKVKNSCGAPR